MSLYCSPNFNEIEVIHVSIGPYKVVHLSLCLIVYVLIGHFYCLRFFSVQLLLVLLGHLLFSSLPQRPMTSDFEGFLSQIISITLFSYVNS